MTLVVLGTVETPYWEHNPGSREQHAEVESAPRADAHLRRSGERHRRRLEREEPFVVKPAILRALFVLNALFAASRRAPAPPRTGKPSAQDAA